MSEQEQTWKTDSMALAAFLCLEFDIVDVIWEDSSWRGSFFWHFTDTEDLADAVSDYMGGLASVDPRKYNDAVSRLKRDMFDQKNSMKAS